jgi:hypothetical protein
MKATKAYIASLGTTGVLLGASLLMLAIVSAVVAFDRWPNGDVSTRVQTLVLTDQPTPIRVSASAVASSASARNGAARRIGAGPVVRNGQGVAGERVAAPHPAPPASDPVGKVLPAVPTDPLKDVRPTTDPIIGTLSNPSTAASQVADSAQSVTDAAGVGLTRVNPDVGDAVAGAGQTAAATIRQLPLPQHVLPGY